MADPGTLLAPMASEEWAIVLFRSQRNLEALLACHAEQLDAAGWQQCQGNFEAGYLEDVFRHPEGKRFNGGNFGEHLQLVEPRQANGLRTVVRLPPRNGMGSSPGEPPSSQSGPLSFLPPPPGGSNLTPYHVALESEDRDRHGTETAHEKPGRDSGLTEFHPGAECRNQNQHDRECLRLPDDAGRCASVGPG